MICRNHPVVEDGIRRCARCAVPFCPDCLVEIGGRPYCATCKQQQLLDVRSGVDRSRLDLATVWRRFGAIFIDGLLIYTPLYIGFFFLAFAMSETQGEPHPLIGFISIPLMFAQFLYEGLMYSLKDGQTLGKLALKIKVVRPDGSSMSSGQSWGRAAMKMVFGCISIFDYLPAFFTENKTTLHDMVAGTRVINVE